MLASITQKEIIIYILLISILFGVIIFLIAGLIKVKNGTIVIIEKIGLYHSTLTKGIHYFMPLAYRRVAIYPSEFVKTISICGKIIEINISISDYKLYHYSPRKIDNILEELSSITYNSINEYISDLSQKLLEISCVLNKKGD